MDRTNIFKLGLTMIIVKTMTTFLIIGNGTRLVEIYTPAQRDALTTILSKCHLIFIMIKILNGNELVNCCQLLHIGGR